jgi:hypothetical protein
VFRNTNPIKYTKHNAVAASNAGNRACLFIGWFLVGKLAAFAEGLKAHAGKNTRKSVILGPAVHG